MIEIPHFAVAAKIVQYRESIAITYRALLLLDFTDMPEFESDQEFSDALSLLDNACKKLEQVTKRVMNEINLNEFDLTSAIIVYFTELREEDLPRPSHQIAQEGFLE